MATGVAPLCMSPAVDGPVGAMVTTLLQVITSLYCSLSAPSVWPEDYGPTVADEGFTLNYDFVVIGSGASGAIAASRLSENPNVNVLLIEAGTDPTPESEIPSLFLTAHHGPSVTEYYTEPTDDACLGTKTGRCYWPIAKVMGGFSSLDYFSNLRGNKAKFDEWNLPTWSWKEVSKYYDLSERFQPSRGRLIANEFEQYTCHISDIIFNGFQELGVPKLKPFVESNDKVGIGYIKGRIQNGQRMGAGKSYLSVAKLRPNLDVLKKTEVKKINLNGQTVSSVTFMINDKEMNVDVGKEVILSAGTIGNAKLLMLSGIGPEEELTELGIPTLVDLPGVGKNLKDQLGVPVPILQDRFKAKPKSFMEKQIDLFYYLTERYGPLNTFGPAAHLGFINGDKSCAFKNCRYPDINLIHWYSPRNDTAAKMFSDSVGYSDAISQSLEKANMEGNIIFSLINIQNPKSVGYVSLQSDDYRDNAKVFANYLQDERDMDSFLQGVKFHVALEKTKAFKKGNAEILQLDMPGCSDFAFKSDDYWRCYIRHMCATMYAPCGTTKMGVDADPTAVVDLRLKVRGVKGLRASGSSVFVSPISGSNTEAMVGERLAEFLKEDYSL